ncbi:MAG: type II toxin-antitoxin system PemK/MazF family toxin [Alphaproteobacteria bacterium]
MLRGDLVTVALPGEYGKPRPALVVQSDLFLKHPSVTVIPLTTDLQEAPLFRVAVEPSDANGLRGPSQVMVDKIQTVSRGRAREIIGRLSWREMLGIERAVALFLGFA